MTITKTFVLRLKQYIYTKNLHGKNVTLENINKTKYIYITLQGLEMRISYYLINEKRLQHAVNVSEGKTFRELLLMDLKCCDVSLK